MIPRGLIIGYAIARGLNDLHAIRDQLPLALQQPYIHQKDDQARAAEARAKRRLIEWSDDKLYWAEVKDIIHNSPDSSYAPFVPLPPNNIIDLDGLYYRALEIWARNEANTERYFSGNARSCIITSFLVGWLTAITLGATVAPSSLVVALAISVISVVILNYIRYLRVNEVTERRVMVLRQQIGAYQQRVAYSKKWLPILIQRLTVHLSAVGINDGPQPDYSQWLKHSAILKSVKMDEILKQVKMGEHDSSSAHATTIDSPMEVSSITQGGS